MKQKNDICTFKSKNYDEKVLTEILKDYVQPNFKTGIICNQSTFNNLNNLLKTKFKIDQIQLIRCKHLAIDIEDKDLQNRLILEELQTVIIVESQKIPKELRGNITSQN